MPELLAKLRDPCQGAREALLGTGHADVVPHDASEFAVDLADATATLHRQQGVDALLDVVGGFLERVVVGGDLWQRRARQVVTDGVGNDEVAVGQPLHQRTGAETVRAVVREVRLAEDVQPGHGAHQVVVDPEPAHRVVDRRVDPHRLLVRILVGDLFVHLEEVAVLLLDDVLTDPLDGVLEVEVDRQAALADTAPVVARLLGVTRGDVAGDEVAEARVLSFEVVVALLFRNLFRRARIALLLRHPHAAIVAQALAHERQLALMVARHRDTGGVNLREARVGEERAALVGAPRRRDVRVHRIGGEVVDRAVAAGCEADRIGRVLLDLAGHQVADDDAARLAVDEDEVEHLAAGEHLHRLLVHLAHQRLVGAEQQLLARLAAGVEGARDLRAAERPVVEQPAVLARERHTLRNALVDDVDADLRQPVHVGFTRPVVAALHRVVEQPVDAVAVVLVVLGRVDAALRRDAVRAPRAVLNAEAQDVVAQFPERGGRRCPGQAGADHDDRELPLVGRIDQLHVELVPVPLLGNRAGGNLCVECHCPTCPAKRCT